MNHRLLDPVVTPHKCQIMTLSNNHSEKIFTTILPLSVLPVSVLPLSLFKLTLSGLRIEKGDLRQLCLNSSFSHTNARILIYCTSNGSQYFSLSIDVFNFQNICKCERFYTKKENFGIYFSIVHISLNFSLRNVRFLVTVDHIHLEGTVSQNFDLCLSCCLM